MKKLLILVFAAFVLTLLFTSCKAGTEHPIDTPPSYTSTLEYPTHNPELSPPFSPTTPNPPTSYESAPHPIPPLLPEEERHYVNTPFLIKLEPYIDGAYSDGYNTFVFADDGTVYINRPSGDHTGRRFRIDSKHTYSPTDNSIDPEEIRLVSQSAAAFVGIDEYVYDPEFELIHKDGDNYYLHHYLRGGGSGESYYHTNSYFVKITIGGEAVNYGLMRAVHMVWHNGYFYYLELDGGLLSSPGTGKVVRMDMDGGNKKTVVSDTVFGPFQILGDRLYYTSLSDAKAYSVSLDGKDKQPVGSRIVPDYHLVQLEVYGDLIISRHWQKYGYDYGHFVFPSDDASPAIMDLPGNNLLTFPAELCGYNAYEVINWGGDDGFNEDGNGYYYLFLKSNYDGSYWLYTKHEPSTSFPVLFEYVREQYADRE